MLLMQVLLGGLLGLALLVVFLWLNRSVPKKTGHLITLIVLGSGGHTAEMLTLVSALDKNKFSPRKYVATRGDDLSINRAGECDPTGEVIIVPRTRRVMQSWVSTVFTAAASAVSCYFLLLRVRPDLLLCNGPGTCVPLCLGAWLNNKLGLGRTKVVFVESVCRVKTLSLSAKILLPFVDDLLVQWPELVKRYPKAKYLARFV